MDDLCNLDSLLKGLPHIYNKLDLSVYNLRFLGPFYYIKKWRLKQSRSSLFFKLSDIFEFLSSIKHKK